MAKKAKKGWYTVAYFTREGNPHPAMRHANFARVYKDRETLLADLVYSMKVEVGHRGSYAAAAWPGQLSEWEAMRGPTKPLFYVYEGGHVEEVR
jgi:hypothetical protein